MGRSSAVCVTGATYFAIAQKAQAAPVQARAATLLLRELFVDPRLPAIVRIARLIAHPVGQFG